MKSLSVHCELAVPSVCSAGKTTPDNEMKQRWLVKSYTPSHPGCGYSFLHSRSNRLRSSARRLNHTPATNNTAIQSAATVAIIMAEPLRRATMVYVTLRTLELVSAPEESTFFP